MRLGRGRKRSDSELLEPNRFIDLGGLDAETSKGEERLRIRVAELSGRDDIPMVSEQVYQGNIVVTDYSSLSEREEEVARLSAELRGVAKDCDGDLVSVGNSILVIAPAGVRIDRRRLRRSE